MEGSWKNAKPNGKFTVINKDDPSSDFFVHFKNGDLDTTKPVRDKFDDCVYSGFYNANYDPHGKGKLECPDGSGYEGNWKNGKRDYKVTAEFVARTLKRPEKWIEAEVSSTFQFKGYIEEADLETGEEIEKHLAKIDWENHSVALVLLDTKEFFGKLFLIVIPKTLEAKVDAKASQPKASLNITGTMLGLENDQHDTFPVLLVTGVK